MNLAIDILRFAQSLILLVVVIFVIYDLKRMRDQKFGPTECDKDNHRFKPTARTGETVMRITCMDCGKSITL